MENEYHFALFAVGHTHNEIHWNGFMNTKNEKMETNSLMEIWKGRAIKRAKCT